MIKKHNYYKDVEAYMLPHFLDMSHDTIKNVWGSIEFLGLIGLRPILVECKCLGRNCCKDEITINGRYRYYMKPFNINGKYYHIYSNWKNGEYKKIFNGFKELWNSGLHPFIECGPKIHIENTGSHTFNGRII